MHSNKRSYQLPVKSNKSLLFVKKRVSERGLIVHCGWNFLTSFLDFQPLDSNLWRNHNLKLSTGKGFGGSHKLYAYPTHMPGDVGFDGTIKT